MFGVFSAVSSRRPHYAGDVFIEIFYAKKRPERVVPESGSIDPDFYYHSN